MKQMRAFVKNIYSWIIHPDESGLNIDIREKMLLLGKMLLLDILFSLPIVLLMEVIHYNLFKIDEIEIDEGLGFIFIMFVIVGPFFEELIFRMPLKYKRNYLVKMINEFTNDWIYNRWPHIFKYFLYIMIVLFGLIHLTNYNNNEPIFYLLSPVIVGSQLLGGIMLSYCRIKLGFWWAVLQHGLFNLFVTLVSLLFFHNSTLVSKSSERTNLEITELMYIDKETSCYSWTKKDSLIYSIDAVNISLYQFMDSLQSEGPKPYDNTWINGTFVSKDGSTKSEIIEIIKAQVKFEE